jgi:3-hydroxybutyryl-CoA dehydrogenase
MSFELIDLGASRSVTEDDGLRSLARTGADAALIVGGDQVARAIAVRKLDVASKRVVAVELETECLGFHIGEEASLPRVIGFARFRLGELPPSPLVELVRRPETADSAVAAARSLFEAAGLRVAVCSDVPGRIVDSLLRPYLNSALRSLDEGLAAPADLDRALCLGLGYPKGPIELLSASGLAAHAEVSELLYAALGKPEFLPAPRARTEAQRRAAGLR